MTRARWYQSAREINGAGVNTPWRHVQQHLLFEYETKKLFPDPKPEARRPPAANRGQRLQPGLKRFCAVSRGSGSEGLFHLCEPGFARRLRGTALAGGGSGFDRGTRADADAWLSPG